MKCAAAAGVCAVLKSWVDCCFWLLSCHADLSDTGWRGQALTFPHYVIWIQELSPYFSWLTMSLLVYLDRDVWEKQMSNTVSLTGRMVRFCANAQYVSSLSLCMLCYTTIFKLLIELIFFFSWNFSFRVMIVHSKFQTAPSPRCFPCNLPKSNTLNNTKSQIKKVLYCQILLNTEIWNTWKLMTLKTQSVHESETCLLNHPRTICCFFIFFWVSQPKIC